MLKMYINAIASLFNMIRLAVSGDSVRLDIANNEVKRMQAEIYSTTIPNFKDDRDNLKRDRDFVSGDYKKAVENKKLEMQY